MGMVVCLFTAWLAGWFVFYRLTFIPETIQSKGSIKTISIIIPARNEARTLPKLLTSLKMQRLQPKEIIVVDDESTDGTAEIARGYGAIVIQNTSEKSGKAAACWLGALHASGEWLLFLDSDTFFQKKTSLERLAGEYERKSGHGILSAQPFHETHRFYEQLSFVFNVVIVAGLNAFSALGRKVKAGGAFGPCILCSKDDYLQTDGHKNMKTGILDDVALAKRFQEQDLPIYLYGGKHTISFRMHPEGFRQLVQGWTKDFATASQSTHPLILLGIILWVSGGLLAGGFILFKSYLVLSLFFYVIYYGQCVLFARRVGNFKAPILFFFPLLLFFFLCLFAWSLIQTYVFKSVTWKGRKVKL